MTSSIIRRLHNSFEIPEGYYRGYGPDAPPLSARQEAAAISDLKRAGIIKSGSADDIIDAMCAVLARAKDVPGNWKDLRAARGPDARRNGNRPADVNFRLRVESVILADPKATAEQLATRANAGISTVKAYRKRMKDEGRL